MIQRDTTEIRTKEAILKNVDKDECDCSDSTYLEYGEQKFLEDQPVTFGRFYSLDMHGNYSGYTKLLRNSKFGDFRVLSFQCADSIPTANYGEFQYLNTFGVYCVKDVKIPAQLDFLKSLMRLAISKSSVASSVSELLNLPFREVGLYDCVLNSPSNTGSTSNSKIRSLSIQNCGLNQIPNAVYQLDSLISLNLKGNDIKTIANEIGSLKHLRRLNLVGNPIESGINVLGQLKQLETLRIDTNALRHVSIETLKELLPNAYIEVE